MKHTRNIAITLICLIMGLLIAWQYKSVYNNNKTSSIQSIRLEDLKDKLLIEKKINNDLRARNDELDKEVHEYESAKGNRDLYEMDLKEEIEKASIIAGFSTVKGPGIVITIKNTEFGLVRFRNILKVVNALNATEAKAVAVNQERITAMTEISEVGNFIIVNGMSMNMDEPFEIKAIVETAKQDSAIRVLGSVISELESDYNLDVNVEKTDSVIIPKIANNRPSLQNDLLTTVK